MKKSHSHVRQVILFCLAGLLSPFPSAYALPVFPGAQGYGTSTPAGRGTVGVANSSTVYVVTSLNDSDPTVSGELRYGIENVTGPRVIVFQVGGVIELRDALTVRQTRPYLTIAGQTAPYPGITLKNAGINVQSHDVLVQHIAIRPGARPVGAAGSGWEDLPPYSNRKCILIDAPTGYATYNVVFDHVSCSWGTDENITMGGGGGTDVRDITISNSLNYEALRFCGHPDVTDPNTGARIGIDGHSAGLYVYKLAHDVSIARNVFAFIRWRNPKVAQGGTDMHVVNNFIYAPGQHTGHRIQIGESVPSHTTAYSTRAAVVGNVTVLHPNPTLYPSWSPAGSKYAANNTEAIEIHANASSVVNLFLDNNHLWHPTYSGNWVPSSPDDNATLVHKGTVPTLLTSDPLSDDGVGLFSTSWTPGDIEEYLLARSGARPGDRDAIDTRIVTQITNRTLRDWMDYPTEYASYTGHGSDGYPTATGSHTLDIPAAGTRQNDDDGDGYTNLEEWLHSWSALVESGGGAPADPSSTVLDNFEDGNAAGWTAAGSTAWSVVASGNGNVYRQADYSADARAILAGSNWTNQVIQADVKITAVDGASRWAGVFGRYTDINNHYYLLLRHGSNTVELRKKAGGVVTTLDSDSFTVALNTNYTLRLVINGTTLIGYVNGVALVTATDSTLASGSVAVGMYKARADINNVYASADPTPTAVLADDFQDGNATGWTTLGTTSWSVVSSGGSLVYQQTNMTGAAGAYAGSAGWTDQAVEMNLRITGTLDSTDRWAGPIARYSSENNYYYMTVRENGVAELKKVQGGTVSLLDSVPITFSTATVYDVKLEVIGSTINGYIGGQLVLEYQDTGSTITAGRAGVRMFKASAQVDDVLVTTP